MTKLIGRQPQSSLTNLRPHGQRRVPTALFLQMIAIIIMMSVVNVPSVDALSPLVMTGSGPVMGAASSTGLYWKGLS